MEETAEKLHNDTQPREEGSPGALGQSADAARKKRPQAEARCHRKAPAVRETAGQRVCLQREPQASGSRRSRIALTRLSALLCTHGRTSLALLCSPRTQTSPRRAPARQSASL